MERYNEIIRNIGYEKGHDYYDPDIVFEHDLQEDREIRKKIAEDIEEEEMIKEIEEIIDKHNRICKKLNKKHGNPCPKEELEEFYGV